MNDNELETEFQEVIEDGGFALLVFNMAQDLVQEKDGKEAQALNMMVGASFALYHAIRYYQEVKNGKSVRNSSRITNSKNGSRLS